MQQEYIAPFDKSSVKTNTTFTVKTKTASMLSKNSKKVYQKKVYQKKVATVMILKILVHLIGKCNFFKIIVRQKVSRAIYRDSDRDRDRELSPARSQSRRKVSNAAKNCKKLRNDLPGNHLFVCLNLSQTFP